jgi:hypothetical protein
MTGRELLEWYNLVFVLPFLAGLGYLLLLATGSVSAGHDGDIDHDVDLDSDAEMSQGFEHAVGHEHSLEHGHDSGQSAAIKALSFIGFGKIPMSLMLMSWCFIWGFTGWASVQFFTWILQYPLVSFWPALATASFSSIIFTRYIAQGLAKVMPSTETYGLDEREFVGSTAEVRFTLTEVSGTATFYDRLRNYQEVQCRVKTGETPIPPGIRVVLLNYNEEQKFFFVRPVPQELRTVN